MYIEAMLEYQMLLRRKSDIAKINAAFKAQRVYGFAYGVRPYEGNEKGFSEKPFNHQVSLLTEYEKDTFIIGDPTSHDLPNPYNHF